MMKSSLRAGVLALCAVGLLTLGMAGAALAQKGPAAGNPKAKGKAGDIATQGDVTYKATKAKSLKGRVYAHWADNPEGEILFGVQYWTTGEPAEDGTPPGRNSDDRDVRIPDPLFVCCAWGYQGGNEKNNPYAGWYNPQTTVRLKVKDKALMEQLTKASQELVAMEVSLAGDGHTITGFNVLKDFADIEGN